MNIELKSSLSSKKTLLILTVIAIFSAAICCLFGEIGLPILIAFCALVFSFDSSEKKIYSLVTAISVASINAVVLILASLPIVFADGTGVKIFAITPSFFGVTAIICAVILSFSLAYKSSKTDTAYIMTLICSVFLGISLVLLAMIRVGELSFEAVSIFYGNLVDSVRPYLQEYFIQMFASIQTAITVDEANVLIDSILELVIGFVFIWSFFIVGLSMKLYCFVVKRLSDIKDFIVSWRFMPTPIFAYFYAIVGVSIMFFQNSSDVLAVAALNLEYIFMFIFAYVGFNFLITMLSRRIPAVLALIICLIAVIVLSSVAIQVLSYVGLMFVLVKDKQEKFGKKNSN